MEEAAAERVAEGERTRGAATIALVAGGVISSYRAVLVERDLWDHVRSAFAQRGPWGADWLDRVGQHDWVEFEGYVALLDVIGDTMGTGELRTLVRKRIVDPAGSNFYAPVLRSWARSFGAHAEHMLRGALHVWRAALRNAGTVRAVDVRPGEVHLVVEGPAAQCCATSPAFVAAFEGLAFGFLDLAQPRPVFVEIELPMRREPVSLVCRFRS